MKQLEDDPWKDVEAKFTVGEKFKGRVTNIADYGAFVELQEGIEGLVHVSEMSWTKKNVHPGKIVSTSQEVEVVVLDVDPDKRRISLGLKQAQENPWKKYADSKTIGDEIEGEVRNVTEFGLFVGLTERNRRHGSPVRHFMGRQQRRGAQGVQQGRQGQGENPRHVS
jgi:small subunit ribosomal protein S1